MGGGHYLDTIWPITWYSFGSLYGERNPSQIEHKVHILIWT